MERATRSELVLQYLVVSRLEVGLFWENYMLLEVRACANLPRRCIVDIKSESLKVAQPCQPKCIG
jgi:hypothetical protein